MTIAAGPGSGTLTSGFGLAAAHAVEMMLPFARSIALAHLLAPIDFGLAIALSVAAATLELVLDFGFDQSAVRLGPAPAGRGSRLDTLHSLQLIRGGVVGLLLAALGPALASLMNRPDAAWAFALLGLGSVVQGFGNLGVKELMRDYRFWPEAVTIASGQFAWTLVTIGTAFVLDDYRCMVAGILAGAVLQMLSSHLLSPRRWRPGWDRATVRDALRFGAPLAPNGMALAATLHGDRLLVASFLGLPILALYSTVFMAAVLPRGVLLRFMQKIALPLFVNAGDRAAELPTLCARWVIVLSMTAFAYGLAFMCLGKPLIGVVFGARYEPDQTLVSLIGIGVCVKFLVALPSPSALAGGRTGFLLAGTLGSAAALVPASILVTIEPGLESFVLGLLLGETVALLLIIHRTIAAFGFGRGLTWSLCCGAVSLLAGLGVIFETEVGSFVLGRLVCAVIAALLFSGLLALAGRLWTLVRLKPGVLFR